MTKLKPGVYCNAGGKITLGTGNVEGMITLVGAEVSLSGSDYNLTPYWNGVLAFATSGSPSAIDASGSNGSWTGIMYAPIGKVKIAGSSGLSIASSIIGDTVVLSGSNFSLQAAAGELPLTQIALIE
ncbi:MAG: hypothetical protein FJ320_12725 [SAR202 cluster bacterium]|nr:hypothetical protein [SAR202 cluster bacterium]